jgi:hypothetical protein
MAKNQAAQDEFVDLYEVLELPENADTETIRQRLNVLYLEAQQNLDHRNVKRRLQFQQMYEIYLPQARHLLLDTNRRGEYDRYLQAYRTGSKVETSPDQAAAATVSTVGDMAGAPEKISHGIPELVEEQVDPEQLAAEREQMWAKWKMGLETVTAEQPLEPLPGAAAPSTQSSPSSAAAEPAPAAPGGFPRSAARPAAVAPRQRPQPVVPRFQPPAPGQRAAATRPAPPAPPAGARRPVAEAPAPPEHVPSEVERQREQQRYQLIKNAVQNAGLMWGAGGGAIGFLVGCAILFTLDNALKPAPFGLSRTVFDLIGFLFVLIASALAGVVARKKAKRKAVAELSQLSMEELMRRAR